MCVQGFHEDYKGYGFDVHRDPILDIDEMQSIMRCLHLDNLSRGDGEQRGRLMVVA